MIVEIIHDDLCGFYLRTALFERAGERSEQHEHTCEHPTLCGSGAAQYWENGVHVGDVRAGGAVKVSAGQKHEFVALEDNTRLTCIFNLAQAEEERGR